MKSNNFKNFETVALKWELGEITLVMGSINELHHARVFDRDGEVMEQKKRKNQVK